QLLASASKPLLYLGGGLAMAGAIGELRALLSECQLPVVSTLKGLGSAPKSYELNLGMLGMHGLSAANIAVQSCDLLVVLGARLDDRATGKLDEFAPHAKVIHLDIDPAEIHKRRYADVAIRGCAKKALPQIQARGDYSEWCQQVKELKLRKSFQYPKVDNIDAPAFLSRLSETMAEDSVICCDVG
ncbi:MAG: acetolactate synthase large subunit, partial [Cellvibrionaceae bacterium]|nr:acetolactate synthase large subunit [Cellvibrionaceae bacterium]